jgi:hypothetical protein
MSNIALYDKIENQTMLANIKELGQSLAQAQLFGVKSDAQGTVMMMTCIAENITPMEFGKTYHIVEGKLSMRADAMQAKFQERGGRIEWTQTDAEVCEAKFFHDKYAPSGVGIKVTMKELTDSGVAVGQKGIKDNYKKFPRQMLRARAISEGVRMVDPSVVAGFYTPEEVSDFDRPEVQLKSPLPRRQPAQAAKPQPGEPKEAEARVVEDPAANAEALGLLAENEDIVNEYLWDLRWIASGKTWRDMSREHADKVAAKITSFIAKARENHEAKELANA